MLFGFVKDWKSTTYAIFRIGVGLLFAQHGAQKLFGLFTTNAPVTLISQFGLAGVIEFFGGLAIALGIFTRLAAAFTGLEMISAYIMVHIPQGLIPIQNGGELALMYIISFIAIFAMGAGVASLEKAIMGKELF